MFRACSIGIVLAVLAQGAQADLTGTMFSANLSHSSQVIPFTHTYGTPQTVPNPFRPEVSFRVTSPGGAPGFQNSVLLNFQSFAYSDYPGEIGRISFTGIAEDVLPGSVRLFNGAGTQIGSASGSGSSLMGTWAVGEVPNTDSQPRVLVAWNSVPSPGGAGLALLAWGLVPARRRRA